MSKNNLADKISKPVIGLTTRSNAGGDFYLRKEYSEAIESLGGIPLQIPLLSSNEFLSTIVQIVDGILLPGSDSDVDPLIYDEEPHRRLGRVNPLRDNVDLTLLKIAEQVELPVLGICFGMQSLNVSRGGTLWQDIETLIPESLAHQQSEPRERVSHHISVKEKSLLRELSGSDKMAVNSHHHQSVKVIGADLKVSATAFDTVIEAIEDTRNNRFAMGVQWHPELGWEGSLFSQNIFSAFIDAAREYRCQRELRNM